MKQKKMLALTLSQLKQLYRNELPEIVRIAEQSDGTESFKQGISEFITNQADTESEVVRQIRLLIEYDGQEVHELSTDEQMIVSTCHFYTRFLPETWKKMWKQTCSWIFSSNSNDYSILLPHSPHPNASKRGPSAGPADWTKMYN
jgi:hypothetical protein